MKYRNAQIEVVSNGFIVTIGCQRVVAESAETMLKRFKEYYDNPEEAEKKLFENSIVFSGCEPVDPTPCVTEGRGLRPPDVSVGNQRSVERIR
jgi:hypothetical protein